MSPLQLKSKKDKAIIKGRNNNPLYFTEFVAFCPHCKNMETIWLGDDAAQEERRYRQRKGLVFHDCGSKEPCRLYGPR